MIERLCIVGVGLIGGSLARALREANAVREIVGASRDAEHLQRAVDLGVIDRFDTDIAAAVQGADMVFLSVPLGAMRKVLTLIKGSLPDHAVVTDGGSAKSCVVTDVAAVWGEVPAWFVPGHPIAGTERSGVEASFAELYRGKRVILTPTASTAADALQRVRAMWEATGAVVKEMDVQHHDEVLAATSHLPHVLAFGLVDSLDRLEEHDDIFKYAAGGFRDFSRIASSSPEMWRDICLSNAEALTPILDNFILELQRLSEVIRQKDGEHLLKVFADAKKARDSYVDGLE